MLNMTKNASHQHLSSVSSVRTRGRVVDLVAPLTALVGPWEMRDGNDEETGSSKSVQVRFVKE
jgi:hypothetical protein